MIRREALKISMLSGKGEEHTPLDFIPKESISNMTNPKSSCQIRLI